MMPLLLAGCVHPAAEPDFRVQEVDPREALAAPAPEALTPSRATLHGEPYVLLSFDVGTDTADLLWERAGIRAIHSVRLVDLDSRPTRRCSLAPTLEDQVGPAFPLRRGTPGVEVAGGTWLQEIEHRDGSVHVALSEDGITAEGWLPETCFGKLWSSEPYLPWPPAGRPPRPVPGEPVPIFPDPTGSVPIAKIVPLGPPTVEAGTYTFTGDGVPLHPLGPVEGSRRLVAAASPGLRVIGWIDAAIPIEPHPPLCLPPPSDPSGGTWIYADPRLDAPIAYALPGAALLPRERHGRARAVVFAGPDGVTQGYVRR